MDLVTGWNQNLKVGLILSSPNRTAQLDHKKFGLGWVNNEQVLGPNHKSLYIGLDY